MTITQILYQASKELQNHKISSASSDAEILLSYTLNTSHEYLLSHPNYKLTPDQIKKYQCLTKRRLSLEPVAYLTGYQEFYGFNFYVDNRVLIPRPETELIIEEIKSQNLDSHPIIIDLGTGSGCLAITLAKLLPWAQILATDVSQAALAVARKNAVLNKVKKRIKFLKGDLLSPLPERIWSSTRQKIILANLPYLNQKLLSSPVLKYEPRLALDGGPDGLNHYRRLLQQLKKIIRNRESRIKVLMEINPDQSLKTKRIIKHLFPQSDIKIKKDLSGLNRIVVMKIVSRPTSR